MQLWFSFSDHLSPHIHLLSWTTREARPAITARTPHLSPFPDGETDGAAPKHPDKHRAYRFHPPHASPPVPQQLAYTHGPIASSFPIPLTTTHETCKKYIIVLCFSGDSRRNSHIKTSWMKTGLLSFSVSPR